jgi:hypothetical protein
VTNALKASVDGERGALRQLLQQSSLRLETMARQVQQAALSVEESIASIAADTPKEGGRGGVEGREVTGQPVRTTTTRTPETPSTAEQEGAQERLEPQASQKFVAAAQVVRAFKALIQAGVYHRTIVEGLIATQVSEPTDFEWQRQLRYYWDRDLGTCLVNIADTSSRYGFEYQVGIPLTLSLQ